MEEKAEEAGEEIKETTKEAGEEIEKTTGEAIEASKDLGEKIKEEGSELLKDAEDVAAETGEKLDEVGDKVVSKTSEVMQKPVNEMMGVSSEGFEKPYLASRLTSLEDEELKVRLETFYTSVIDGDEAVVTEAILGDRDKQDSTAEGSAQLYRDLSQAEAYQPVYARKIGAVGFEKAYLVVGNYHFNPETVPLTFGDLWLYHNNRWEVAPMDIIADQSTIVTKAAGASFDENMENLTEGIKSWSSSMAEKTEELSKDALEKAQNFGQSIKDQLQKLGDDEGSQGETDQDS